LIHRVPQELERVIAAVTVVTDLLVLSDPGI
jgi:hypothetical protein